MLGAQLQSACFLLCSGGQLRGWSKITHVCHVTGGWLSRLCCHILRLSSRTGAVQYGQNYVTRHKIPLLKSSLYPFLLIISAFSPLGCLSSCFPHTDGMFGWYNSEVWDLGHRWTGTLPQLGPDVLQRSSGRYRGLRHHQHRESHDISEGSGGVRQQAGPWVDDSWLWETFARWLFLCILFNYYGWKVFLCFQGYVHTCKELGEGTAATSQPQHRYRPGRKQSRPGQQARCRSPGKETLQQAPREILLTANFQLLSALFYQEAQAYADDNSLLFMETSAKTAMNVNEIFMAIGEQPPTLTAASVAFNV